MVVGSTLQPTADDLAPLDRFAAHYVVSIKSRWLRCDYAGASQTKLTDNSRRQHLRCVPILDFTMWHGTIAVLLLAIQLSTTCLIVGFAPRRSIFRLASLPLTILYTYLQFTNLSEVHHPIGRAFLGGASTFAVILFVDLVLLSQWTFEAKGPTSTLGGVSASLDARHTSKDFQSKYSPAIIPDSIISRLQFGFSVGLQTRFPKSNWKIKNIPPFYRSRPYDTPSRTGFLIWSISKVALYIVFLRAIGGQDSSQNQSIFSQAQVPVFARLGSITPMELTTRLLSTLGFWTALVMVDDMLYSFLAIPAILFRLTGVDAWPPIFGWPQDAYCIRQFWG